MSYLKLLVGYNTVVPKAWVNNTDTAFNNLQPASQAKFVLEQAVLVNFMRKLYNGRPPVLISSYIKRIEGYAALVNQVFNNSPAMEDTFKENVSYLNELLAGNVPGNTEALITRIGEIISANDIPHILDDTAVSFYRPFLTFFGTQDHKVSIDGAVSIPTFALRGRMLFVNFTTKMVGYHFNETTLKALENGPYPISPADIFGYFAGYNWKDIDFNQLLVILSSYAFDMDGTNVAAGSYEMIYKLLKSVVTAYTSSVTPYVDSLSLAFDDTSLRRLFIAFLIDLRKIHSLKLDDAQTLAKVMGNDKQEDIENLNAYLEATRASDISVEMYNAFKNSIFSDFEELFFENRSFKKKENTLSKTFSTPGNLKRSEENLKALYLKGVRITDTAASVRNGNVEVSDAWSTEADMFTLDTGKPSMKDENATASGDVGATGDDDTTGTESDTTQEASTTENGEIPPSNDPSNQPETVNAHIPDLPDVSDKKGVKLELSASESTDTVFYRLELKTYINGILANPPKYLSVQKIEALKKIKAFWINTLAPQCLHDVLSTIIKLPSMFKIHKHKG